MPVWLIILIIVLAVLVGVLVALYIISSKAQKRQAEQDEQMRAQAQTMNMFIIDKKKMNIKDSGLPKIVIENSPKLAKISKVPILKVKAGNRVLSLMCDPEAFKTILPNQEVKAQVAGLYVISAKRLRGPVYEPKNKKKKVINKHGKEITVTEKKQSWIDKLR